MSAREEILRRLRATAYDAPLPPVIARSDIGGIATRDNAVIAWPEGPKQSPTALFIDRAQAAGVEVVLVPDRASLARLVVAQALAAGVRSAAAWEDDLLAPIVEAFRGAGLTIVADPAQADAGITTADFAIAETGTLVLATAPGRARGVSLLPPRHLAVLPDGRIVGDLFDLMPLLGSVPSALIFVTGPSRTADIELTPVRGAHGPVAVQVFLVA